MVAMPFEHGFHYPPYRIFVLYQQNGFGAARRLVFFGYFQIFGRCPATGSSM